MRKAITRCAIVWVSLGILYLVMVATDFGGWYGDYILDFMVFVLWVLSMLVLACLLLIALMRNAGPFNRRY
jgi:hypothetical protein